MSVRNPLIDSVTEADNVDFKQIFDSKSAQSWIEIIKDIVAMANTNGGLLLIGVNDDGSPAVFASKDLVELDVSDFVDKIYKYTNRRLSGLKIYLSTRAGSDIFIIEVSRQDIPVVFTSPGTYEVILSDGKKAQKSVWPTGSIYFRHSARSDPGTSDDLARWIQVTMMEFKANLLEGIAKVVEAPQGSRVEVIPRDVVASVDKVAFQIRITDDPTAHAYTVVDVDKIYPHRQIDVLGRLAGLDIKVNSFDLLLFRKEYATDKDVRYSHKLNHASQQYSDLFVELIREKHAEDAHICAKLRSAHNSRKLTSH